MTDYVMEVIVLLTIWGAILIEPFIAVKIYNADNPKIIGLSLWVMFGLGFVFSILMGELFSILNGG